MESKNKRTSEDAQLKTQGYSITAVKVLQVLTNKPQSKAKLQSKTGLSERDVRRGISELRKRGVGVVSSSRHGSGYWLGTPKEIKMFTHENGHRAMEILKASYAMKRKLKKAEADR